MRKALAMTYETGWEGFWTFMAFGTLFAMLVLL